MEHNENAFMALANMNEEQARRFAENRTLKFWMWFTGINLTSLYVLFIQYTKMIVKSTMTDFIMDSWKAARERFLPHTTKHEYYYCDDGTLWGRMFCETSKGMQKFDDQAKQFFNQLTIDGGIALTLVCISFLYLLYLFLKSLHFIGVITLAQLDNGNIAIEQLARTLRDAARRLYLTRGRENNAEIQDETMAIDDSGNQEPVMEPEPAPQQEPEMEREPEEDFNPQLRINKRTGRPNGNDLLKLLRRPKNN